MRFALFLRQASFNSARVKRFDISSLEDDGFDEDSGPQVGKCRREMYGRSAIVQTTPECLIHT